MGFKLLRSILKYLFGIAVLFFLVVGALVYFFKDDILDQLTKEVNKHIKTELSVESIDINLWQGFPYIAAVFSNVEFKGAFGEEPWLTANQVNFNLNALNLLEENIQIQNLEINNAKLFFKINKAGAANYDVFVLGSKDSLEQQKKQDFLLKNVTLNNVIIRHSIELKKSDVSYKISRLKGSIFKVADTLQVNVKTNLEIDQTNIKGEKWLTHKKIFLDTKLTVLQDTFDIGNSTISIENNKFLLNGFVGRGQNQKLELHLQGKGLLFGDIVNVLPPTWKSRANPLRGKGQIAINATISGTTQSSSWPGIEAYFSLKNFELHHNKLKYPLKNILAEGKIKIAKLQDLNTATLHLSKFETVVNERKLFINGDIINFGNPKVHIFSKGDLDAAWVLSILAPQKSGHATIRGGINIDAEAYFDTAYKKLTLRKATGNIRLDSVSVHDFNGLSFKNIAGKMALNENIFDFKNVHIIVDSSSAIVEGVLKIDSTSRMQNYTANLDIKSPYFNLDEVIKMVTIFSTPDSLVKSEKYPTTYAVQLGVTIDKFKFLKFNGSQVHTNLRLSNNGVRILQADFKGLGGHSRVSGQFLEQFNGDYFIEANISTNKIALDSLFYVFGNFKQNFITDKEIKGDLNSNIYTKVYLTHQWALRRKLLYAEAMVNIKNGELNNFEPIMSLSEYLHNEEENLARLRFSELENRILINQDTVFIADMNIGSNVRNIKIGGYHTLLQHIDYRLAVPFINDNLRNEDEFGTVRKDSKGRLFIPFKIKGTTEDYKVTYDLKTAGSNFFKGIGSEVKGLTHLFSGKNNENEPVDTLELEDEEYFDWEDNR